MQKKINYYFNLSTLFIFIFSQVVVPSAVAASAVDASTTQPITLADMELASVAAPGPDPAPNGYSVADPGSYQPSKFSSLQEIASMLGNNNYVAPLIPTSRTTANLKIYPITAYNLIVDSNVLAPSSYGPSAATIGAKFCNESNAAMTDVWMYAGDFNSDNDEVPDEANDKTPGLYPQRTSITENPGLNGPTQVDSGDTTRMYALKQESGTLNSVVDASRRYVGDLAVGQCLTQYWLISYPRKAYVGGTWVSVTGGIKPEDDLWLPYYFWATSNVTGSTPSYVWRPLTMRNEISAMANKIWPNGDNKVPDEYVSAIQQVLGWDTWTPNDPSGATAYPGETVTSQGIWYDLGNVGAGFDNNGDLVPDRNIWVQPIGDASAYDPGCFRLVRTYGLVIIKLNDGTEMLIPFVDEMYFENIPDNNTGAVGLVFYEYIALDGACSAGLTPYQEVASGYDNEKFNGDFGAGIPPIQSRATNMLFDKTGAGSIALGGTINYSLKFTLPDIDGGTSDTVTVGSPSVGAPLTFFDTVPSGLQFDSDSYSTTVDMTNYSPDPQPATVLVSKDSGTTWYDISLTASRDAICGVGVWPCYVPSTSPNNLVMIQWRLNSGITSPNGSDVIGEVVFSAFVPNAYTGNTISNTACMTMGTTSGFICDDLITVVSGTSAIQGTVWKDDSVTGGVLANAIQDGTEAGIGSGTPITVWLYWDNNGDGDYTDSGDFLYATTTSDASGNYCFDGTPLVSTCLTGSGGLLATTGSARYIIVVDTLDPQLPTGYGPTTATSYKNIALAASTLYGDDASEPSDFGFGPALTLDKNLATTTAVVVGDTVTYSILLTNHMPGDGSGGSACVYKSWSPLEGNQSTGVPPNKRFANTLTQSPPNPTNAFNSVGFDSVYAISDFSTGANQVLGATNYTFGPQSGTITKVNLRARYYVSTALVDDFAHIGYYTGGTLHATKTYTTAEVNAHIGFANSGYLDWDFGATNPATAANWQWSELASGNTIQMLFGNDKAASADISLMHLDGLVLEVTTTGTCGGISTTLNPVPLTDTFNSSYFTFISSDPPVSSTGAGSLTWNNVGPIYPGQTRVVTVNMRAIQNGTTTNTDNTATSTSSKFASGLPANSPVTDTATVVIGTNAATRSLSGHVFDDNITTGWLTAAWSEPGTAQAGYDGSDSAIPYIPVDLYACVIAGVPVTAISDNKACNDASVGGTWQYLQSTSTNTSGDYTFSNLRQGYYYVVVHSEYIVGSQTADVNQNGVCTVCDSKSGLTTDNVNNSPFPGDLSNNTTITNVNFGYNVSNSTYNIGDTLFYDWNGDGIQDGTDEPMSGITIELLGPDGTVIATTTTNSSGVYGFSARPVGYYTVRVATSSLPSGVTQSLDPDATKDNQSSFNLTANDLTRDFAYQPVGSGTIGDTVFVDLNGNGLKGSAEEGLSGVTVKLQVDLNGDGTYVTIATQTTSSTGAYLFEGLPVGASYNYRVVVELSAANLAIIPNDVIGNDYLNSTGTKDVTPTPDIIYINASITTASPNYLTADFGFAPPASFGDTVYQDINGNGTQDLNEPGISGVTVNLYYFTDLGDGNFAYDVGEPFYDLNSSGTRQVGESFFDKDGRYQPGDTVGAFYATATTDANGKYQFAGLLPGYYVAQVTPPAGSTLTGDPNTDGISCSTLTLSTEPPSTICDHRDGMRLYNGTNYLGADFGYQLPGAFGDTVWIDTNGNNKVDIGESGIDQITVTATTTVPANTTVTVNGTTYTAGQPISLSAITDANGNYFFSGITIGGAIPANVTWIVTVNTADPDFPVGLTNVSDPDQLTACNIPGNPTCTGYNSATNVVMNPSGAITQVGALTTNSADGDASDVLKLDADFGYRFVGITDISGTICGETTTVNGFCGSSNIAPTGIGAGEIVYDNVTVYLYRLDETGGTPGNGILDAGETTILVGTTITNANGDYAFYDVADGTYYVIAIGAPQDGLDLTSTAATVNAGADNDANQTGQYQETVAGDGDTLSAYQVVHVAANDTSVTDRDFAFQNRLTYDYGDLPVAYSMTRLDDNPDGARHTISGLYLGAVAPDADGNGYPSATASNDDNVGDDEEGVTFTGTWTNGDNGGSLSVVVTGSGYLVGWIDINGDGDFNDGFDDGDGNFSETGEWREYIISQAVTTGTYPFTVDIPAGTLSATPKIFNTRFRLFTTMPLLPALSYTGAATGGEVEDYQISVVLNGTPIIPPHTTPVTLSYFQAQRRGSKVEFNWSTATETSNLGFNLYVENNGQLIQINQNMIPSQVVDSLNRHDYSLSVNMGGDTFYIEDVSVLNETTRHGPFRLGAKYGDRIKENKIDLAAIEAEHNQLQAQNQNKILKDLKRLPSSILQLPFLKPTQEMQLVNTLNLKVRKTGIYRVTYEELKSAGLDLAGVSVKKLTLTNRGKVVPIYVDALNNKSAGGSFGAGKFIEFYAEALDTIYTDTNIYTLQVGKSQANRISEDNGAPSRNIIPSASYTETILVNKQIVYSNIAPGTDVWFDTAMLTAKTAKSWTFNFQVNGLADASAPASLDLVVWGVTNFSQNPDHHLLVSINGVSLANQTFEGLVEHKIKVSLPAGTLHEGSNTLQLTLPGDTGARSDLVNLDKFSISYQRFFAATDGKIAFTATGKVFTVTNLPGKDVVVYRIDNKGIVRLQKTNVVKGSGNTYTATFGGTNAEAKYLVSTVEVLSAPTLEPTRLQVNLNNPAQYLIISHPDFIDGLQPLIQARRAQGLTVSVVDVTNIYTQYSYGIFDPLAIQKYIAYAKKSLGAKYVLLVGGDTYDYRNYLGINSISFIPSLYVTTGRVAKFVPVDPLYADVDNDNVPDLAIGRFPVRTRAELDLMVNKTLAYTNKNYGKTAVFTSDKYDGVVSFKEINASLSADLPAGWSSENINLDDLSVSAAQSQLFAAMNRGTALVTFTGHSGPTSWTFSNLFNTQVAATLTNAGRPFVLVQWGCWNTYYVDPLNNNLVQSFLFSGDKGAAAVFGAVTLTDSSSEAALGVLLTPRMIQPGMPMGMALQDAKRELAKTHPELLDVLLGWTLMGDPALVVQP